MKVAALLILASSFALPNDYMEIAIRVAGEGRPDCQSFGPEGSVGPCLPDFAVRRSSAINATRLARQITFTTGATSRLSKDEFALLAGHEIAHYYLDHKGKTLANELAADRLGAELACKAGYNPINGASLFRHARSSKVHPSGAARRAQVLALGCDLQRDVATYKSTSPS